MKKYIIPLVLVVYAAALIYMFIQYKPGVKIVYQQTFPTVINQPVKERLIQGTWSDYSNIFVVGSKLHPGSTAIVAENGVVATSLINTTIKITGSGGAVDISKNPQIVAGTSGQIIILQGNSNTNTVLFEDGTGLQLNGNAACTLGVGDKLCLQYDATDVVWYELYRSDN